MLWENIGPIIQGDKSLLDYDLTHPTSGLAFYPAFDTGWAAGKIVIAPERLKVTRHSGDSHSGYSFYATGDSKLRYYVTHLRPERTSVGSVVGKGGRLGVIGSARTYPGARVDHAHVGVNVELLLGAGKQLKHNLDYTHGQPTIRDQLNALLKQEDEMTRERALALRKAAFTYHENGRITVPPEARNLSPGETVVFYTALLGIDKGIKEGLLKAGNVDLLERLAKIHDLSKPS